MEKLFFKQYDPSIFLNQSLKKPCIPIFHETPYGLVLNDLISKQLELH